MDIMSAIAELISPDVADAVTEVAKPDIRERLAAEMDEALGKGKPATPAPKAPAKAPARKAPTKTQAARAAAKAAAAEPTPEEREALLKAAWDSAGDTESQAKTVMDQAKLQWENTRVLKCRVAFLVADYVGFKDDGTPNLLAVARILGTEAELTAAERTKKAKNRKNSFRNYVAAGMALDAEGMARRITEPDAEERRIVAEAFRAGNDRPKDETHGKDEGAAGGEPEADGIEAVALGVVDIVGHIARMQAAFKLIKDSKVVVSEQEAAKVAEMLGEFSSQLAEYAEGV